MKNKNLPNIWKAAQYVAKTETLKETNIPNEMWCALRLYDEAINQLNLCDQYEVNEVIEKKIIELKEERKILFQTISNIENMIINLNT